MARKDTPGTIASVQAAVPKPVQTVTTPDGGRVEVYEDHQVVVVDKDGYAVSASGMSVMTEFNWWSAQIARQGFFMLGSDGLLAASGYGPGPGIASTLQQGLTGIAPANVTLTSVQQVVVDGTIGVTTNAISDRTALSIDPVGTKRMIYYQQDASGNLFKLLVVQRPDGTVSLPQGGWTPAK